MNIEQNIDAIIFDMDGVLLDTESVSGECWKKAGLERGFDAAEITKKCVGRNAEDTLSILSEKLGGEKEAKSFYARTGELFKEIEKTKGLKPMPFAFETLSSLKKRGIRLALASSTRRESVERQLKNANLWDFFETTTTGDTVKKSKPNPEIYLKALSSLNVRAENAVAVEDSPNGVRAAAAAKIKCIMIPDQIQPDEEIKNLAWKIIPSLKELENIIIKKENI